MKTKFNFEKFNKQYDNLTYSEFSKKLLGKSNKTNIEEIYKRMLYSKDFSNETKEMLAKMNEITINFNPKEDCLLKMNQTLLKSVEEARFS